MCVCVRARACVRGWMGDNGAGFAGRGRGSHSIMFYNYLCIWIYVMLSSILFN